MTRTATIPDYDTSIPLLAKWLNRIALVLTLAILIARLTMLETLRDPSAVSPNTSIPPRAPGANTSVLLDWLSLLPAVLICLRAGLFSRLALVGSAAAVALAGVAAWAVLSTAWAGDKLAAVVGAFHLVSLATVFWTILQLTRDWLSLRLLAAVSVGILLVLVVHGALYTTIDAAELRRNWVEHKTELLQQRNLEADSFAAHQLERKIISGEVPGFAASPNTYGAQLVLLAFVLIGVSVQRICDRAPAGWWIVPALALLPTVWMIYETDSRTALGTPVLGLIFCAILLGFRPFSPGRRRFFFWLALAVALLGMAALVAHGLHHGTLFHDSLTFRWRYWVASWRIFVDHPWRGVGWNQFGQYYVGTRLPIAAEEIKDPHNFLVRVFVELGLVGGVMFVLWLLRAGWEAAVNVLASETDDRLDPLDLAPTAPLVTSARASNATGVQIDARALALPTVIGVAGILLNIFCTIDWSQEAAYNGFELLKRLLYLCVFVLGASIVVLDPRDASRCDARPAPWLVRFMVIAAALFLVHNSIDFSLWENGAGLLFAMVLAAAIGVQKPRRARPALLQPMLLGAGFLAVLTVSLLILVIPIRSAESIAQDGDDALRRGRAEFAADDYQDAFKAVPYNGDYAFREAQALLYAGVSGDRTAKSLDQAIAADPLNVGYYVTRAEFNRRSPQPNAERVLADLRKAVALNPNEVQTRITLADALAGFGRKAEARAAYEESLKYNELLHPDEPKRLNPAGLADVRRKIDGLR